jgi:DNA-directed RNA polymerase subunit beta
VDTTVIFKIFQNFFGSNQLSQYMDETNPLSEITQKRKICLFTSNGSNRNSISIREIQPSQYGRICPIETPEGQNTGLISSLTVGARINKIGIIESPFYKIKNKIKNYKLEKFFLSPEQEEKTTISNNMIFKKQNKKTVYFSIKKNQDFSKTNKTNKINFIGVSALQMISIATALIPFLEHNDANRVLMGSNMQRQAVPILNPENPIVGTGLELETARDNGTIILAKKSGVITETNSKFITIKSMQTINRIKLIEIKNYWQKFSTRLKFQ